MEIVMRKENLMKRMFTYRMRSWYNVKIATRGKNKREQRHSFAGSGLFKHIFCIASDILTV